MSDNEGRIAGLPIWSGPVEIAPLSGGISTVEHMMTDPSGTAIDVAKSLLG